MHSQRATSYGVGCSSQHPPTPNSATAMNLYGIHTMTGFNFHFCGTLLDREPNVPSEAPPTLGYRYSILPEASTLSTTHCSGCVCIYLYVVAILAETKAHYVVQAGLKFLGSCDPLASASGMAGDYRCLQQALAVYHKPQKSYHSSLF